MKLISKIINDWSSDCKLGFCCYGQEIKPKNIVKVLFRQISFSQGNSIDLTSVSWIATLQQYVSYWYKPCKGFYQEYKISTIWKYLPSNITW